MTSISDTNVVNAPGGLVELGSSQYVSNLTVNHSAGSGVTGPSDLTVSCDGSPILVEFWVGQTAMLNGQQISASLYIDGVETHRQWYVHSNNTGNANYNGFYAKFRHVPAAGIHTYGVRFYGTGQILATGSNNAPAFLRVSKIIQASQLLVQTPNAPLVTSLPSNAIDGQEVRYLADNTNGIIWNLRYRAGSSSTYKWEYIGGNPLFDFETASVSTTSGSFTSIAGDNLSVPIPLVGEYDVEIHALGSNNAGAFYWWLICPFGCSYPTSDQRGIRVGSQSAGAYTTGSHRSRVPLTVGTLTAQYRQAAGGTMTVAERSFTVTPIRVSA
jgi:hypothetical protein